ncbi:hypothetical protein D9M71_685740 [compost metagenome]
MNAFQQDIDRAIATQAERQFFLLLGILAGYACAVAANHGHAGFGQPPGLFRQITLQAAAAHRTDRGTDPRDEHACAGPAVGRTLHPDHSRQHGFQWFAGQLLEGIQQIR